MDYKPGNFYDIKWNGKEFKHCELLEILPGTSLAAVRTPKYEYFEIHTNFLLPEEDKKPTKVDTEPVTLHLEEPLHSETTINVDMTSFEELVNIAAKSVADEFKGSCTVSADPLVRQKACKYDKFKEAVAFKLQECEQVINDEYALKKNVLKANTIKEALLEIQSIIEG